MVQRSRTAKRIISSKEKLLSFSSGEKSQSNILVSANHVYSGSPRLTSPRDGTVCGCLHRRATHLQAYHCSTSFSEGPYKPKQKGNGDVATAKALIDSKVFCRRVRAACGVFAMDKLRKTKLFFSGE